MYFAPVFTHKNVPNNLPFYTDFACIPCNLLHIFKLAARTLYFFNYNTYIINYIKTQPFSIVKRKMGKNTRSLTIRTLIADKIYMIAQRDMA